MTRNEFFAFLAPYAVQLRCEGSPMFPSVRLAQNLLETGGVILPWYNLGGIKVGSGKPNEWWDGSSVNKTTWEVINGVKVDTSANFRAYQSVYHFYKDQDMLFQLPNYERVCQAKTPEEQAMMLQLCGYATDPEYSNKLAAMMNSYGLKKYDKEAEEMLKELQQQVEQLIMANTQLQQRVADLERLNSMPIPEWAKAAVDAAVESGLVDTPSGGSYDFYRVLTVLNRKGVI